MWRNAYSFFHAQIYSGANRTKYFHEQMNQCVNCRGRKATLAPRATRILAMNIQYLSQIWLVFKLLLRQSERKQMISLIFFLILTLDGSRNCRNYIV